jgi:hypothetical protein
MFIVRTVVADETRIIAYALTPWEKCRKKVFFFQKTHQIEKTFTSKALDRNCC